jgi:hypothetical protein
VAFRFHHSLDEEEPALVIDLHPQSAAVDCIATNMRSTVTGGDSAGTGIDQIVAADSRSVALRQPF